MSDMQITGGAFGIGDSKEFQLRGDYFELIDCPSPVDVLLLDENGVQMARMEQCEATFFIETIRPYKIIKITSATAQSIRFYAGGGKAGTRRSAGVVSVSGFPRLGTFANAAKTVSTASASLVAANAGRNYLLVQNKHATQRIWLTFGAAATQANGVMIIPGGNFSMEGVQSTQQVFAIGETGANNDIVVVEA